MIRCRIHSEDISQDSPLHSSIGPLSWHAHAKALLRRGVIAVEIYDDALGSIVRALPERGAPEPNWVGRLIERTTYTYGAARRGAEISLSEQIMREADEQGWSEMRQLSGLPTKRNPIGQAMDLFK